MQFNSATCGFRARRGASSAIRPRRRGRSSISTDSGGSGTIEALGAFTGLTPVVILAGGSAALFGMATMPTFAQGAVDTSVVPATTVAVEHTSRHTTFILNTLLFLIGGFLVFFMACGFCMLESGLVRAKNVTMQLTKNVGLFSVGTISYYLVGYNLMYPGEFNGWIAFGNLLSPAVLEPAGVTADRVQDIDYAAVGSDFFFQVMFCAAAASIVSGALAERIKLVPFLVFTFLVTAYIYPIQASWTWGGGWLDAVGFADFAGSTIVHSVGGWAALAGAIVLGPRAGKFGPDGRMNLMPGSNLAIATLGMFILWLGWFGFNGGSQLAMGTLSDAADVSRIVANTNAAAAGGALAALALTIVLHGRPDLTLVLNGALAGLVSITAEPLAPSLGAATLIGGLGGIMVVFAVPMLDRLRIDDVVGAIPVHLFAGIWGTLAVVLTNPEASLVTQLIGIGAVGIYTFGISLIVWLALKAIMGIRVSLEAEIVGLDLGELGMEAYPEFSKAS